MAKTSKKSIAILLICMLVAALGLTGCGGNEEGGDAEMIKIGIMQFGEFEALQNANQGFQDGLAELGYKEGENVTFNYLSAAADTANCPTIADTLINDGSDLILAIATPSASAIKEKTSDIPVLFTAVTDPAGSGLVAANDAPGGNLTGTSDMNPVAQQIALGKQLIPDAKKVAIMYCSSESNSKIQSDTWQKQLSRKRAWNRWLRRFPPSTRLNRQLNPLRDRLTSSISLRTTLWQTV